MFCRIRNPDMTPCEGVAILDMGHKIGCNGVDNGQLIFNHYVAPRWAINADHIHATCCCVE
jgi:acyl-CoA oxidase